MVAREDTTVSLVLTLTLTLTLTEEAIAAALYATVPGDLGHDPCDVPGE